MNPFDILKYTNPQALQQELEKIKQEAGNITATGSSGGNMVRVTVNGRMEMLSIELDPVCVDNRDVGMLQDLIVAAHHDAISKIQEIMKQKAGPLVQSMNIPGMNS